jgi:hypothetical protein
MRPPLEPLGRLLAYSYQLLAQLTTVKTMLLLQRGRLTHQEIDLPLKQTTQSIEASLMNHDLASALATQLATPPAWSGLSDPFDGDLNPWLLRRLQLAQDMARQVRCNADQVLRVTEVHPGPAPTT